MSTIVPKAQRPAYLANVLCIAKVTGDIASTESLVLRSIIHGIGGTRDDVATAGTMLADGHYQLQVPGSPAVRLANLQDMVMVALADGDLSPLESKPIEMMAKAMGYAQADMDLVVRRAQNALQRIGRRKGPLTGEDGPVRISIEEEESADPEEPSSPPPIPSAPPTPPPAEPAPEPEPVAPETEEGQVPAPEPEPVAVETPSSAPTAQDDIGEPAADSSLPANVEACMQCRAESEHPETYCFGIPEGPVNPWGCRLSQMPWEPEATWFELGHFRDDVTFVFDKHAIAERLTAQVVTALSCPHLDTAYTEAAFECLPDRAVVGPRWQYRPAESDDPDATTITTTHYIHGCALSATLSTSGVDPIGTRDALKIIHKASRRV